MSLLRMQDMLGVLILFCSLAVHVQQPTATSLSDFRDGQSVYVLAVKTSSEVDRLLGDRYFRNAMHVTCDSVGEQSFYRNTQKNQPRPEIQTLERSLLSDNPMVTNDQLLETKIKDEFRAQKKFKLAQAADGADFVFFAFSKYPANWIQASRPSGAAGSTVTYNNYGDSPYSTQLVQVLGFALSASVYKQVRKDVLSLSDAAQWQGYVDSMAPPSTCSVSAQQSAAHVLVKKFHEEVLKKKKPGSPQAPIAQARAESGKSSPALPVDQTPLPAAPVSIAEGAATFKVETSLVVVPCTVLDAEGRFVSNLTRSDFHVFEDNVEQQIEHFSSIEAPFNVVLLLDTSSSMSVKEEDVQRAAAAFVAELHSQDRVMIVSVNGEVYLNAEFTGDHTQLEEAIRQTHASGGTRLYDAVDLVLTERLSRIAGRKAIVLFSDGVDNESRLTDASRNLALAERSGTLVYTIHYDTSSDVPVNPGTLTLNGRVIGAGRPNAAVIGAESYRQASAYLADLPARTGARAYQAKTVRDLNEAFSQIADDLRQQYEISYYPTYAAHDGSYRHIRLQVDRSGVNVRARPGYQSAKTNQRSPQGGGVFAKNNR